MKRVFSLLPAAALLAAISLGTMTPTARAAEPATSSNRAIIPARCFERSDLLSGLAKEQGEWLSQTKRVGEKGLLEAFASPTDGTWTIVYSDGDKRSCIIASGDGLPVALEDDRPIPKRVEQTI